LQGWYPLAMQSHSWYQALWSKLKQPAFFGRRIRKEYLLIALLALLATLDYFFTPQSQTLEQISESKVLRVLISDDPDAQYSFNKQHYGFEYEMLRQLADSLDVNLELKVVPYGELFSLLNHGTADLAIGGILASPFVSSVAQPTQAWYRSRLTIVYKRGEFRPLNASALDDKPIFSSARFYSLPNLQVINQIDDYRSEYQLLTDVANGSVDYALSTNYRARNAKHYLPNLNRAFLLDEKVDLVWALPKRFDPRLKDRVNEFLEKKVVEGLPKALADEHFRSPNSLPTFDALGIQKRIANVLPDYEYRFRQAARQNNIDWTLLAALAYQESRWSNDAVSPTGVRGIMQITTETADFLDISDRMDIDQSITAGAEYLKYLKTKIPSRVLEPERTWFAIGAYNIGLKHVLAAYRKVRESGEDPTKWEIENIIHKLCG